MRVLVACEFSGIVREAFRERGHDAWSCDLLPTEMGAMHHVQCDVIDLIENGAKYGHWLPWDVLLGFPPCTHLCVSGARWWKQKQEAQRDAIKFVSRLWESGIPRIAIENPIGILSRVIGKPTQIIQPWQFGHGETKATCLWLKNLPPLKPTNIVEGREARVHRMPPGPNRWRERSRTFQGIANAMAEQWSNL